ncbi:hypothetical protein V6N13_018015 [Hibiscus sabdariffa]
MEIFQNASLVRLRSHHERFLVANDDQQTVGQDRDGSSVNARWTVEFPESSSIHIRLKSCHGKYLTASNMPFLIGMRGKRVLQTLPRRLTSSVEWEPVMEGVHVRFKTRYFQFLRANGKFPPWRGHITHDVTHRSITQYWCLWDVEVLEHRDPEASPRLLPPPEENDTGSNSDDHDFPPEISFRDMKESTFEPDGSPEGSAAAFEGRVIKYEIVEENGDVNQTIGEQSFIFTGSGVKELKKTLEAGTGMEEDFTICLRDPSTGKLCPLRLQLPPDNSDVHVVLVPDSSKGCLFVIK